MFILYFLDLIETFYHIHPYLMTHQMNLKCIRNLRHTISWTCDSQITNNCSIFFKVQL
jgi:hypothetical protein